MRKDILLVITLAIVIIVLLLVLLLIPAKKSVVSNGIQINSPGPNEEISPPMTIIGIVDGNGWSGFEGQVGSVKLLDSNGVEIISGPLTATSEWTKLPTSFRTVLDFDAGSGNAILVFHNENPSGDPTRDKTFILPIKLK
jgi:hypothetical protein